MKKTDTFANLPKEKQDRIINAALAVFGTNGYKKASINDIAITAGISKSMVFHYFGSKKALYLYLIELSINIFVSEMQAQFDKNVTDFFDRILLATKIKVSIMKKHSAILAFFSSMFVETDKQIAGDIKGILSLGEVYRDELAFDGMDESKFKENVDPQLVLKILVKFAEGYVNISPNGFDIDEMMKEFKACLNLMKNNFYKEEYR